MNSGIWHSQSGSICSHEAFAIDERDQEAKHGAGTSRAYLITEGEEELEDGFPLLPKIALKLLHR